jgi:predicted outer membrane repeat protein
MCAWGFTETGERTMRSGALAWAGRLTLDLATLGDWMRLGRWSVMRTVVRCATGRALAATAGSIVVLVVLWFPVSAGATSYTVNTTSDASTLPCPPSHQCSLRQAIAAVNASPSPPDVINVPAGIYQLSQSGGLVIARSVTIVGDGSPTTTVNGGGVSVGRVFQFNQTSGPLTVTMSGLTITNGNPGNASGGGIETNATASLTDVVVSGNTASGSGGGIDSSGTLTLTNSTVSNNVLTGTTSAAGGGINNSTRLTLDHVTVSGNSSAGEGGGIESSGFAPNGLFATDVSVTGNTAAAGAGSGGGGLRISANAILTRVTVSGNSALTTNSVGGGIYNSALSPDAFTVTDSTISGNSQGAGTGGEGGSGGAGIFNSGDSASITRVTVSSNFAGSGQSGGGLYNTGTLALTDVTVGGNTLGTNSWGAGIYNSGDPFTANRVTISDNSAGPAGQGGGVFNTGSSSGGALVQFTNVTISDNSLGTGGTGAGLNSSGFGVAITNATIAGNTIASGANGGGLWTLGTTTIQNSIVAANTANDCGGGGTLTSAGHNIAGDASCGFSAAGDSITANPGLKPLAANGGPTQTRALTPGSPAIDAGNDGSCPPVDQRGVTRPQLAHCDIGAYEYSPPVASAAVPRASPRAS